MPVTDVFEFNRNIVDATCGLVCAFKPNFAFYEAMGLPGLDALAKTVEYIHQVAPDVIVIGDVKRGDVGPSSEAYAHAAFNVWGFDAVTVNPWAGLDSVAPFLEQEDRGAFVWCRGSNPGSADLQDLTVDGEQGRLPVYLRLAESVKQWDRKGNVGLVVGATYPQQLEEVRRTCSRMPILVPGVGPQGGDLEAVVRIGVDSRGRLAIVNSSRGVIYASNGPDYAEAAGTAAGRLREAINQTLASEGKGWP
jgi:orotidine-5'-phosphate decarboxylase